MLPTLVIEDPRPRTQIERWLEHLGPDVCELLATNNVTIIVLREKQLFSDVSPALRRLGAGVDRWPIPPAGLFIVEERTLVLRSTSNMTFFHEAMHAVDLCLGGAVYRSTVDPRFRRCFERATAFVTPYAASGIDEYWAESARSWWGSIANDARSLWPRATRERLQSLDAPMYEIVRAIFEEEIPRAAAARRAAVNAA